VITDVTAEPDVEVMREPLLFSPAEIAMTQPTGFGAPAAPYNYSGTPWADNIWTVFFHSDAKITVVQASNTTPISGTLYFWVPAGSDMPANNNEVRAVTFFGPTGEIRYWKYNGTRFISEDN